MKKLNLKSLAKEMGFREKVKLIFEDSNRRYDTRGKESVLNVGEEEAFLINFRKNRVVDAFNDLVDLFNIVRFCVADVDMARVRLELAASIVREYMLMRSLIYAQGIIGDKDDFDIGLFMEKDEKIVPDLALESGCLRIIQMNKYARSALFVIAEAEGRAEMSLVSAEDSKILRKAESCLRELEVLGDGLGFIKICYDIAVNDGHDLEKFFCPDFLRLARGEKEVFYLNDEDEKKALAKLDKALGGAPLT
jgi:hypothetical protein